MKGKEITAIQHVAHNIDIDANLFIIDENVGGTSAIQYCATSKETVSRFFSAFEAKGKITSRIIFSRLKKTGLPPVGVVSVKMDGDVVVVIYERRLDKEYGYRNQSKALEKFFSRNLLAVELLADHGAISKNRCCII